MFVGGQAPLLSLPEPLVRPGVESCGTSKHPTLFDVGCPGAPRGEYFAMEGCRVHEGRIAENALVASAEVHDTSHFQLGAVCATLGRRRDAIF